MYTIFIEYRVIPHAVSDFLQIHYSMIQKEARTISSKYQFLKGTDQPDIFVEMFHLESLDLYNKWKEHIATGDPALLWSPIIPFIAGGSSKFHMWAFQKPALSEYTK